MPLIEWDSPYDRMGCVLRFSGYNKFYEDYRDESPFAALVQIDRATMVAMMNTRELFSPYWWEQQADQMMPAARVIDLRDPRIHNVEHNGKPLVDLLDGDVHPSVLQSLEGVGRRSRLSIVYDEIGGNFAWQTRIDGRKYESEVIAEETLLEWAWMVGVQKFRSGRWIVNILLDRRESLFYSVMMRGPVLPGAPAEFQAPKFRIDREIVVSVLMENDVPALYGDPYPYRDAILLSLPHLDLIA